MKENSGKAGEDAAAEFLVKNGYRIIERNLRIGGSEIDIIARKDRYLIFIEVKSRFSDFFGDPTEFVNDKKIKKIVDGAKMYSSKKKFRDLFIRFDIAAVKWVGKRPLVDYYENAFEFDS